MVADATADGDLSAHPLGKTVTSLLGVPLLVGDRPIGALEVGTLFARRFTDADIDLLQLAADRAALAIERVRLFERQQTIAEELQRSLLPQTLPIVPGLGDGRALLRRRRGDPGGRRLVRHDPAARRPRGARHRRRRRPRRGTPRR